MTAPIICFGQQPCGFFPKRFLFAKIQTGRRLQNEIGGEIVFFFHDSDHDPRETRTSCAIVKPMSRRNLTLPLKIHSTQIFAALSQRNSRRLAGENRTSIAKLRQSPFDRNFPKIFRRKRRGFLSGDVSSDGLAR